MKARSGYERPKLTTSWPEVHKHKVAQTRTQSMPTCGYAHDTTILSGTAFFWMEWNPTVVPLEWRREGCVDGTSASVVGSPTSSGILDDGWFAGTSMAGNDCDEALDEPMCASPENVELLVGKSR